MNKRNTQNLAAGRETMQVRNKKGDFINNARTKNISWTDKDWPDTAVKGGFKNAASIC